MAATADSAPRGLDRATTWIAAGSAVNGLAALLFQVVGTRALGLVGYAPIGVLWTLQYLWIAVAVTAVEAYVTRLVTIGGPADLRLARFLRLFVRWLLAASVVTAIVGALLAGPLFEGLETLGIALGLVVLGYGWYGVVRGRAAGANRFRDYALATTAESVLRLAAAVAVLSVVASTAGLAWTFPVGPLAVGVWAWSRSRRRANGAVGAWESGNGARMHPPPGEQGDADGADAPAGEGERRGRRFLAATSTANAAVQFLLAGGPLVLLPLGADAATVSVFFTTITAARVPMTFALNGGLSRVLPPLTLLAESGDVAGLRRASQRVVVGLLGATAAGAVTGGAVGPQAIALVFGGEFRPDRVFATLVGASTVLAVGGLLLDQVYIAMGREERLPQVWSAAVALAGVLVVVLPGTATMRVAIAFTTATAAAVVALSVPLLRRPTAARPEPA